MIDYRAGVWGFHVALGLNGSLAPRALTMALPNAFLTLVLATMFDQYTDASSFKTEDNSLASKTVISSFTVVMTFILYNRSRTSYNRWWEGGTLLQKTRGEWFNAYSSIMAFTSTRPELADQVESYTHLLARLMSLLMCCALQQVSPNRNRRFEVLDLEGIEPASMEFLNSAPDKVEIILQWIQRSMILHTQTGVLPVAPPILSRAFQEVSRGIVNLQNARKIADFPYPFPLAQISMVLQLIHYGTTPFVAAIAFPAGFACLFSFSTIFVLWCIHFNALDLEFPFGARVNDLPMNEMQRDWNSSLKTMLFERASRPPQFDYDPKEHQALKLVMSDASDHQHTELSKHEKERRTVSELKVFSSNPKRRLPGPKVHRAISCGSLEVVTQSLSADKWRDPCTVDSEENGSAISSPTSSSSGMGKLKETPLGVPMSVIPSPTLPGNLEKKEGPARPASNPPLLDAEVPPIFGFQDSLQSSGPDAPANNAVNSLFMPEGADREVSAIQKRPESNNGSDTALSASNSHLFPGHKRVATSSESNIGPDGCAPIDSSLPNLMSLAGNEPQRSRMVGNEPQSSVISTSSASDLRLSIQPDLGPEQSEMWTPS